MEKNIEKFMEALDTSIKYEEGLGDVVHKTGTAIKNFFGTKAGVAQRAVSDAKTAAQTTATQKQADDLNPGIPDNELAATLNKAIEKAIKIANSGLQQLQTVSVEKKNNNNGVEQQEQADSSQQQEQEQEQDNTQEKQQESLFRDLLALQEADANKTQKYYRTAIKSLQGIQNLIKPILTGQKEFDKDTLKAVSDKINDQSVQGVLGKNDKKALKVIQQINSAINAKIKSLEKGQSQNSQQSANNEQAQNPSQQTAGNASSTESPQQPTQNTEQSTQDNEQQQETPEQNKDPTQMQPEEIKQQPEGQQVSKEFSELEAAITNLTKKFGSNKAIRTLGNAWETFKSMNSKGGADKILQ